jgi:hypothetical protein
LKDGILPCGTTAGLYDPRGFVYAAGMPEKVRIRLVFCNFTRRAGMKALDVPLTLKERNMARQVIRIHIEKNHISEDAHQTLLSIFNKLSPMSPKESLR